MKENKGTIYYRIIPAIEEGRREKALMPVWLVDAQRQSLHHPKEAAGLA